jgi:hypothetical protein
MSHPRAFCSRIDRLGEFAMHHPASAAMRLRGARHWRVPLSSSDFHDEEAAEEDRPEVELYDPFDRRFVSKKRTDPHLRLYDDKVVKDDF